MCQITANLIRDSFFDLKTKQKIFLGFCAPLLLLAILGGIAIYGINSVLDAKERVEHTHVVLGDAAAIVRSAVDMETGMRGYLLAGREQFLAPYKTGETATYKGIVALQKAVDDNPKQVARLGEVEKVLREWQKEITEPTIQLRRVIGDAQTMNDMAKLVGKARGKFYFDKIRAQIKTFQDRETTLLKTRRTEFKTAQEAVAKDFDTVGETIGWVGHTHEVLASAQHVLAQAVDMETGLRGYLLAGVEEFLDPYKAGKTGFYKEIRELEETVNDNPAQVARLKEAAALIRAWNDKVTEPDIAKRRLVATGGADMADIVAMVNKKTGKRYFDAFRAKIAEFSAIELKLMRQRQATADKASTQVSANLEVMRKDEAWVTHTYEVLAQANAVMAAAVDMETGMRGYLLAGQEAFLAPYSDGAKRFFELAGGLSRTVNDNPAQVKLLAETQATITEWRGKVTEPAIALRRQIGNAKTMDDMADLIGEARGKRYFDRFRELMSVFSNEETNLMEQRLASNASTVVTTYTLISLFIGIGILIGIVLAWFIGNGIARPIAAMTETMLLLSKGDYAVEISYTERRDEIGAMAGAVLVFKNNAIERDRLEKQLRRAQRMEAVGQLTGGIAHDFNNILSIIMGNLRLLKRQTADNPEILELADDALAGTRRGADITKKLLAFSRRNEGDAVPTAVNGIIERMRELIARSLTMSIKVETHLAGDLWLVEINRGDFEDIILNLSLNARDAMREGGRLVIETTNKYLDESYVAQNPPAKAGEYVMISVSDTGTGMTAEVREKMFEPFFTTKHSGPETGQGTGLGLSMVHAFVQRSGGHIKAYSELGAGSIFRIYLPRTHELAEKIEPAPGSPLVQPRGSETILIVDDEEVLLKIATSYLRNLGYKTMRASNGRKALEVLEAHRDIDLLFSDIIMPGDLDGYQEAAAAHEIRPDLKILLTSGVTNRRAEYANGGRQFFVGLTDNLLPKPYNDDELSLAVRRALDN